MKLHIWPARTIEEVTQAARLYLEYSASGIYVGSPEYEFDHVSQGSRIILCANSDAGELLGVVQLLVRTNLPAKLMTEDAALLQRLRVVEPARRQGVAEQLCLAAEKVADEHGFQKIKLVIEAGNDPARRLYEKLGYAYFLELTSKATGRKLLAYEKHLLIQGD